MRIVRVIGNNGQVATGQGFDRAQGIWHACLLHSALRSVMKYAAPLGRIAGIRVFLHWTFLFLIAWIVFLNLQADNNWSQILWTVALVLTLFVCVTLHELGHSLVARRFGIRTRHITLLPIGGIARMESLPEKPREELWVALAGPLVNLVIAALIFPFSGWRAIADDAETLRHIGPSNFLYLLMTLNVWLALFNLIPAFPMDGGRVFRALLGFRMDHLKATRIASVVGKVMAIGLATLGFFYNPILFFIGIYIFFAATAEARTVASRFALKGYTVNDALITDVPVIEGDSTVREASDLVSHSPSRHFLVREGGYPAALLNRNDILSASHRQLPDVQIHSVRPRHTTEFPSGTPLEEACQRMVSENIPAAIVRSGNDVIGMLDEDKLAEFILLRLRENGNGQQPAS